MRFRACFFGLIVIGLFCLAGTTISAGAISGKLSATPAYSNNTMFVHIDYSIVGENGEHYWVSAYNNGSLVRVIDEGPAGNGTHHTYWDGTDASGTPVAAGTYTIVLNSTKTWGVMGSFGTGTGQFYDPYSVAVDGLGNIYVADNLNHRIQVWNSCNMTWSIMGSIGVGTGQFLYPTGVEADGWGNIYVADSGNHRIQVWNSTNKTWSIMGSSGTGTGQFQYPSDVAVDGMGNIYVTDSGNNRIQVWNSTNKTWSVMGSSGTGAGQFNSPFGVAVDGLGNIYVTDSHNYRIQVWNSTNKTWSIMGSSGTGTGQFNYPSGVAVDGLGNIYVADFGNNRIQVWNSSDMTWSVMGSNGSGVGQFSNLYGVALDGLGNIYVADTRNNRIQCYGFFVGSDITVSGAGQATSITIQPGWNLIGWKALSNMTASQLEALLPGDQGIYGFDATAQKYYGYDELYSVSGDFTLEPGVGYFIVSTEAATLNL